MIFLEMNNIKCCLQSRNEQLIAQEGQEFFDHFEDCAVGSSSKEQKVEQVEVVTSDINKSTKVGNLDSDLGGEVVKLEANHVYLELVYIHAVTLKTYWAIGLEQLPERSRPRVYDLCLEQLQLHTFCDQFEFQIIYHNWKHEQKVVNKILLTCE